MISLNDINLDNIELVGLNNVTLASLESVAGVVADGSGYIEPTEDEPTAQSLDEDEDVVDEPTAEED